jgi:cellulose biosynthesis protein BcsQ
VYDFVFFDCPPGFSNIACNVFSASDMVLMPVIPTTLSLRTYEQVISHFNNKQIPLEKLRCFFSMVDSRKTMHKSTMKNLDSDNRFFDYYIPYLSDIEKMGLKNAPVTAYSPSGYAAVCYHALWEEIKAFARL